MTALEPRPLPDPARPDTCSYEPVGWIAGDRFYRGRHPRDAGAPLGAQRVYAVTGRHAEPERAVQGPSPEHDGHVRDVTLAAVARALADCGFSFLGSLPLASAVIDGGQIVGTYGNVRVRAEQSDPDATYLLDLVAFADALAGAFADR